MRSSDFLCHFYKFFVAGDLSMATKCHQKGAEIMRMCICMSTRNPFGVSLYQGGFTRLQGLHTHVSVFFPFSLQIRGLLYKVPCGFDGLCEAFIQRGLHTHTLTNILISFPTNVVGTSQSPQGNLKGLKSPLTQRALQSSQGLTHISVFFLQMRGVLYRALRD